MIKIRNLSKSFDALKVLNSVSFDIPDGQTFAVMGPSGCGKSTLLRLILALESPDAGAIFIDDRDITKLSGEELIKTRQKIGMAFQSSALFDSLTVFENVAFGLREQEGKISEREIKRIVEKKLELVELAGKEQLMPDELSGGMQKRVSVARALAFDPKIILYDEPTTGLDPITSITVEKLINKLSRELKVTSIIVTHQLTTIFRCADRIIMLHEGQTIDCGTVEETKRSTVPVVKKFIEAGLEGI